MLTVGSVPRTGQSVQPCAGRIRSKRHKSAAAGMHDACNGVPSRDKGRGSPNCYEAYGRRASSKYRTRRFTMSLSGNLRRNSNAAEALGSCSRCNCMPEQIEPLKIAFTLWLACSQVRGSVIISSLSSEPIEPSMPRKQWRIGMKLTGCSLSYSTGLFSLSHNDVSINATYYTCQNNILPAREMRLTNIRLVFRKDCCW